MNLLFIFLSGDAGMGLFIGLLTGVFFTIVIAGYNYLKPKVQNAAKSIKLHANPDNANSLIERGDSELSNMNYSFAIEYYRKAINLSPDDCRAISGIAYAYHMKKDYGNSKKYLTEYQDRVGNNDNSSLSTRAIMAYLLGHHAHMVGNTKLANDCKKIVENIASIDNKLKRTINGLNLY